MLYQLLRMQAEADGDGVIHLAHHLVVHPAHMLPQTLFVQCPDLLQQDHRIFGQAEAVGGQGDMGGQAGLSRLGRDGRRNHRWAVLVAGVVLDDEDRADAPCSLPTTGLRSA